jgi:hypothetical protein
VFGLNGEHVSIHEQVDHQSTGDLQYPLIIRNGQFCQFVHVFLPESKDGFFICPIRLARCPTARKSDSRKNAYIFINFGAKFGYLHTISDHATVVRLLSETQ